MPILTRSEDRESIEAAIKSTPGADWVDMVIQGRTVKLFCASYCREDIIHFIDPAAEPSECNLFVTTAEKGRRRVFLHETVKIENPPEITSISLVRQENGNAI